MRGEEYAVHVPWRSPDRIGLELKQQLILGVLDRFRAALPPPPRRLSRQVQAALAFIHEHLFDPRLNVARMRRVCGLRNNNSSANFRCEVGVGPREYIEAWRIHAAQQLLRHEALEIYLIAGWIGYEHQETFCRAFKRRVGTSPSVWRSRWMAQRRLLKTKPQENRASGDV